MTESGVVYYSSPLLAALGVPHGFSTRLGGISSKPFDSLNLGNPQGAEIQDTREQIGENFRRFQQSLGLAELDRCWVHQVHGADVVIVRREHEFTNGARADVLVSDDPARVLTIRVADCVPVLISTEDGSAVAAVHAGWRGVVAGAVPNAIRELRRFSNQPLFAAIGPCISKPSFEVGDEVLKEFEERFSVEPQIVERTAGGKGKVDLPAAVKLQLFGAGVSESRIDGTDRCTYLHANEFFSHRREKGLTGRMAALMAPRGG